MNLMPQSGQDHLGQLADELADVGHDQALDDRVQRQVGRRFGQGQTCLSGTGPAEMKLAPLTARSVRSDEPSPRSGTVDTSSARPPGGGAAAGLERCRPGRDIAVIAPVPARCP